MFWVIMGHLIPLFLSTNYTTTLEFEEPIEQVIYGGSHRDLYTYLSQSKKTLVLKALSNSADSNLTILTKQKNYTFLIGQDAKPHLYVKIVPSNGSVIFSHAFENDSFVIKEGDTSILIQNKTKNSLEINGLTFKGLEYFSKGIPIIFNGKRVFN
jgi:hypothetical protein